jgi:hypothetical protein
MAHMPFVKDDGGRAAAGFKGSAGDCVARSVAIASGRPYAEVYAALAKGTGDQRRSRSTPKRAASARNGVNVKRKWFRDYMASLGFEWVPTMQIGSGCKVHLCEGELPMGRLVVAVSGHYTAVIDGALHDTWDCQRTTHESGVRDGISYQKTYERCVYGYWRAA